MSKNKKNHTDDKIEHEGKNSEFEFSEDVEIYHGFDKYEDTSGLEDEVGINPSILQIECNPLLIYQRKLEKLYGSHDSSIPFRVRGDVIRIGSNTHQFMSLF